MATSKTICTFCGSINVTTLSRTLKGSRAVIEYRCDGCQKTWTEQQTTQLQVKPKSRQRNTGSS
jgi:transposase-like protein